VETARTNGIDKRVREILEKAFEAFWSEAPVVIWVIVNRKIHDRSD
jgi:hypothetical protein